MKSHSIYIKNIIDVSLGAKYIIKDGVRFLVRRIVNVTKGATILSQTLYEEFGEHAKLGSGAALPSRGG
jgi:hypothetical protein